MRDADAQLFRVRNADMSGFDRVLENVMATPHAPQYPAIGFELLDDLLCMMVIITTIGARRWTEVKG